MDCEDPEVARVWPQRSGRLPRQISDVYVGATVDTGRVAGHGERKVLGRRCAVLVKRLRASVWQRRPIQLSGTLEARRASLAAILSEA